MPAECSRYAVIDRVISGGQTGVDRAALDIAIACGIEHGGWCPLGRRAEDGRLDDRYELRETQTREYHVRTELNVQAADGTLILALGELTGGTQLTRRIAIKHAKPYLIVDPSVARDLATTIVWLTEVKIRVLNIAGPRESSSPGIYAVASDFLRQLLLTVTRRTSAETVD